MPRVVVRRRRPKATQHRAAFPAAAAAAATAAALLATFAALADTARAIDVPPNDENNTLHTDSWSRGRVRGIRATPTQTNLLRKVPGAGKTYAALARYFEDAIQQENCALRDNDWIDGLKVVSGLRAWSVPDTSCVSSTRHRRKPLKYTPVELRDMIVRMNAALQSVAQSVNKATIRNFTNPTAPASWPHAVGSYQRCVVQKTMAVRYRAKGGKNQWYFISGITNDNITVDFSDWNRQFVNEFVGTDDDGNFVSPLPMKLRKFQGPGSDVDMSLPRIPFPTSFELWGGRVGLSALYNMNVEDAPAVIRALAMCERNADQANDALTPSNIAILALPMVLNVVPVALVADVSTMGLLVYTIMTDVLTTVPFIIKGFELIGSGSRSYIAEETWFAGRKDQPWIVAEAWAADCRLAHVADIGVAFVCLGFAFLCVGIVSEWQARKWREQWLRKHGKSDNFLMDDQNALKLHLFHHQQRQAFGLRGSAPLNPDVLEEEAAFVQNQLGLSLSHPGTGSDSLPSSDYSPGSQTRV